MMDRAEASTPRPLPELLRELRGLGARVALEGERLRLNAPKGALPETLLAELAARRAELAAFLTEARNGAASGLVLQHAPPDQAPPLSFAQQRLWFLQQLDPHDTSYNLGILLDDVAMADEGLLRRSLESLALRHHILRTAFPAVDGVPFQQVTGTLPALRTIELGSLQGSARREEIARLWRAELVVPFDLAAAPPFRALLIRVAGGAPALVLVVHHILVDGWSLGILVKELGECYTAHAQGRAPELPPLRWQYGDYAYSQKKWFQESDQRERTEYWTRKLSGLSAAIDLPIDRPRGRDPGSRGAVQLFTLPAELTERLRAHSRESGVTLFTTMLSLFQVLLHRYSGQNDILVGTPVANRSQVELEPLMGLFVSTLVLRNDLSGDPDFREVLQRVHRDALEAREHGDYPFEHIVNLVRADRGLAHSPLFQVAFVLHNTPFTRPAFETLAGGAMFELSLHLWDGGADLPGSFEFNTALFDAETIARMAGHLRQLAEAVVADAGRAVSRLPLLTAEEQEQLLDTWNRTDTVYPRHDAVHRLFEEQALATPDAVAVIEPLAGEAGADRQLTYGELDRLANRLAERLMTAGVRPGGTVAVAVDRSAAFVTSALAVLKAGAAYVPLDPALPRDRLSVMLEDAAVQALVTRGSTAALLPGTGAPVVELDDGSTVDTGDGPLRPAHPEGGDALAYVMYTSGSTGRPRGVCVPHRAIARLVRATNYVRLAADDVILACAPVTFDASTFEIWGALLNGGRLVIHPRAIPEPDDLAELIRRHRVTTLWLTAGLFHLVVDENPECLAGLRQLLAGGDVLSPSHVRKALKALQGGVLINGYGPTENTTFTCCHRMTGTDAIGETVPIGRPISNTRVYVLDRAMRPVPIGVRGELWTGGDGLALGYLKDPALTAARFMPDPFSGDPAARLYRTGDLVRYRPDGVLEFLGRIDKQVKIRGFRIEPGEIEAALGTHPAVAGAVVVARRHHSGEKQLAAYVVARAGAPVTPEALRAYLVDRLPTYAVPSAIVMLPALPLSPNGKVDHEALPSPPEEVLAALGPRNALEAQLVSIWEQVLGVSGIGLRDNFFAVGGDSLLGIRLLANLEKALGRRIPISVLFQGQTIEAMAEVLKADPGSLSLGAIAIQPGGSRPPLFVIPGVGGSVIGFHALARALGPDQPLYGLRSRGLDGEAEPLDQVPAIAERFLKEIRRVQPVGPYRLLGFCMGGIVAYEMAQQLVRGGEEVELLALVETWPPVLIPHRRRLPKLALSTMFFLQGAIRHLRAAWHQPWGGRIRYLREKSRILSEMVTQRDVYRGDRADLHRELVMQANQKAAASYVPAPYPGSLLLIFARDLGLPPSRDPRVDWQAFAKGECAMVQVTARDSGALLRQPEVQGLAEALAMRVGPPEQRPA